MGMATKRETYPTKFGTVDLVHSHAGCAVYLDGAHKGNVMKTWRKHEHHGWTYDGARFSNYANQRQAAYDLLAPIVPTYKFVVETPPALR